MPVHDEFQRVACQSIIVRSDRQRRKVDTSGLRESISAYGVLQPIVVNRLPDGALELVFGERRLTSCLELHLPDIPVRFLSELSQVELKLLEFEENNKRSDLHWRDMVNAVAEIHTLQHAAHTVWTMADTGRLLNYSSDWVRKLMRVYADLDSVKIATAPDINSAYNI
jgi:ParB/RepB/Spo0J family partition protein